MATAICMAESRGNTLASYANTNGTVDRGLFEVNSIHADLVHGNLASLYDARTNVTVAHELWKGKGWAPWTTYWNGRYKQYL